MKSTSVLNRFLLGVTYFALAVLWHCFMAIGFLGLNALNGVVLNEHPGVSYVLFSVAFVALLYVASALSLPFAAASFKRLNVQYPWVSGIAFFMMLIFGSMLSTFIVGFGFYPSPEVYTILVLASNIFAISLYAFVVQPLKYKLSTRKFLVLSIGLSVITVILCVIQQLWLRLAYG